MAMYYTVSNNSAVKAAIFRPVAEDRTRAIGFDTPVSRRVNCNSPPIAIQGASLSHVRNPDARFRVNPSIRVRAQENFGVWSGSCLRSSILIGYILGSIPAGRWIVRIATGQRHPQYRQRPHRRHECHAGRGLAGRGGHRVLDVLKSFLAIQLCRWVLPGNFWLEAADGDRRRTWA